MANDQRLLGFVAAMTRLVQATSDEDALIAGATPLMRDLVTHDDWLPDAMAASHPQYYQQHLLYGDPLDRFSLVSFVWGPGQKTPVHDHTVWGIIGMLRGAENGQRFAPDAQGHWKPTGERATLQPGDLDIVSPARGDVHEVSNAIDDSVSISIHLYGGNIGRVARHAYVPGTSTVKTFVSGYSNLLAPNLWPRPAA
ncbi:cysteine dioxygenase family protein [Comamonas badia]|uniref:cysteine dioxygenase family protein n=1 Tax=Comamonas badia TaxID=265291 RepID=UPI0003F99FF9|nr:cysteine dioxygenase [Comamonas badia]